MERINMPKWQYSVNCRFFNELSDAKKFANETEANEILLTRGTSEQILYLFHPMTERLERVQTVREAKIKLNKI